MSCSQRTWLLKSLFYVFQLIHTKKSYLSLTNFANCPSLQMVNVFRLAICPWLLYPSFESIYTLLKWIELPIFIYLYCDVSLGMEWNAVRWSRLNDALWAFGSSIERESVNDANGSGNRFLRAHNSFISFAFFDSKKGWFYSLVESPWKCSRDMNENLHHLLSVPWWNAFMPACSLSRISSLSYYR
jgi:hypothetical protein